MFRRADATPTDGLGFASYALKKIYLRAKNFYLRAGFF